MGRSRRLRPKHLGKKLKQIREMLELSQVGMAEALDFSTVDPQTSQATERARGNRLSGSVEVCETGRCLNRRGDR